MAQAHSDSVRAMVTDTVITTELKPGVLADGISKGFEGSVTTISGVVVLKGTLLNQNAIEYAKDIVQSVRAWTRPHSLSRARNRPDSPERKEEQK